MAHDNLAPIHALCRAQTFSQVCVQHTGAWSALTSSIRTLFMFQVLLRCTSSATEGAKRCAVSMPPWAHARPSSARGRRFAGDHDDRVVRIYPHLFVHGRPLTSSAPSARRRRLATGDFEWMDQPPPRRFFYFGLPTCADSNVNRDQLWRKGRLSWGKLIIHKTLPRIVRIVELLATRAVSDGFRTSSIQLMRPHFLAAGSEAGYA